MSPSRSQCAFRILLALLISCLGCGLAGAAGTSPNAKPTLFLIGDSTVKNGSGKGQGGLWGWGDQLAPLFDQTRISIQNRALGGRSSRTFLTEGLWDKVLAELKPGDYVLMQFGHNDGGELARGSRPRASLKGNGEETRDVVVELTGKAETVHSYGWYLRRYVADARARGATPIVLSQIPRNMWNGGKVLRAAGDYGKWAAEAARQGGAAFIDLNGIIAGKYDTLGEAEAKGFFTTADHTHTNLEGARFNAAALAEGIRALAGCTLKDYLKQDGVTKKAGKKNRRKQGAPVVTGQVEGRILTAGSRDIYILNPDGSVAWRHKTRNLPHDVWMLPNGNVLYADEAAVSEVTPEGKVAWQYTPAPNKGGGAFACQRLENGNTLVGENSTGRVLEVAPDGKVVFELKVEPFTAGGHHNMRMARKLAGGNYLVCQSGAQRVREYTPKGEVAREFKVGNIAFSAVRTPQNTTVIGCIDRIVEFDAAGKAVWEFKASEIPGVTIGSITGIHLLPSGNIAAGVYRAYTKDGKGVGLFEITRDKKLVWSYANPAGGDDTMMPIEMLTADGKPLAGEALR